MDYARDLLFEFAVARIAIGGGVGVCSLRDLGVLGVAAAVDGGSGNRAGARGRCLVVHHRALA